MLTYLGEYQMYNPLPKQVEIRKSPIHGYGLFAKEYIPKNTILGITHVAHDLFPDGWLRTPLGGFYNHSETPNCESVVLAGKTILRYLARTALTDNMDEGFLTEIKLLKTLVDIPMHTELTCTYTIWKATPEMKNNVKKIILLASMFLLQFIFSQEWELTMTAQDADSVGSSDYIRIGSCDGCHDGFHFGEDEYDLPPPPGYYTDISFFNFVVILSVTLGLINLFPIPILDGGHLLFYLFEFIRGKPLGSKVQEYSFLAGLSFIVVLMIFTTFNDLTRPNVIEFFSISSLDISNGSSIVKRIFPLKETG